MTTLQKTQLTIAWQSITTHERLDVQDRAQLLATPDACVAVGTAPDGLPLVLRVSRSASIVEPVLRAMNVADMKALSTSTRGLLSDLNHQVQTERTGLGIAPQGPFGACPHYVSMNTLPTMLGDTLLCRLLGARSPLLLDEDTPRWARGDEVCAKTSAGVLMSAADRQALARELGTRQHLCVPLDDGVPAVVRQHESGTLDVTDGRPLVFEDLRRMRSARFHGWRRSAGTTEAESFAGELGDNDAYRRAVARAHSVGWSVTRADLLGIVVDVARSLAPLHQAGLVHGDIKPANVLITADGAHAHDALSIKVGAVSAAGTKGWNAPEQIIARPVSPATDVFALAQLVVQILEAAVFGDERSFVVPIGGGKRTRERMIAVPDVYLDPQLVPLHDPAIAAWRAFLRRCLVLDTDKRVPSAVAFADELAALLERFPVPGRRAVSRLAGRLVRSEPETSSPGRRSERPAEAAWVLEDSYAHVDRTPWTFVFAVAA